MYGEKKQSEGETKLAKNRIEVPVLEEYLSKFQA